MRKNRKSLFRLLSRGGVIAALFFLSPPFFRLAADTFVASTPIKLTAHDMEVIFNELVPAEKQQVIASHPEEKKKLVSEIKKLLSVAQAAEQAGYAERSDIESQILLQSEVDLNKAYRKKNPDARVTDEEVNAYHKAHPTEFDEFSKNIPRLQEQPQGTVRDELRRRHGVFKVIVERARKEGIERDDATRLTLLLDRAQVLADAYLIDLQKNADEFVSDIDIEQYFNAHRSDFDEVRVRHILISTLPPGDEDDSADVKHKKSSEKAKPPDEDEPRKKAQKLLNRARKGEDFAKLARQNSEDPTSKEKGGALGFFGRGRMEIAFEKAAFELKPGEISDLVETPYGFHIIRLEERRSATSVGDKKVREQILESLKQKRVEAKIEEIAANSDVVVTEDFPTVPKIAKPSADKAIKKPGMR